MSTPTQGPAEDDHDSEPLGAFDRLIDQIRFTLRLEWRTLGQELGVDSEDPLAVMDPEVRLHVRDWLDAFVRELMSMQSSTNRPVDRESFAKLLAVAPVDDEERERERESHTRDLMDKYNAGLMSSEEFLAALDQIFRRPRGFELAGLDNIIARGVLLALVEDFLTRARDTAERALRVLPYVLQVRLPPTVSTYVVSVARLFAEGRHVEGLVFARAVLEAALKERITDDDVMRSVSTADRSRITLAERIQAAAKLHKLDAETARLAQQIRIYGNDAVHPSETLGVGYRGDLQYLPAIARVLNQLYRSQESR